MVEGLFEIVEKPNKKSAFLSLSRNLNIVIIYTYPDHISNQWLHFLNRDENSF